MIGKNFRDFSNDWKIFFQWLENSALRGLREEGQTDGMCKDISPLREGGGAAVDGMFLEG